MMPLTPLSIAISPCPNDTFIVDHFLHDPLQNKFDCNVDYFDIQQLNTLALTHQYDVIKVSVAMLPQLLSHYKVLRTGAALGQKNGPLVIAKKNFSIEQISSLRIVTPGQTTSANLLFHYFFSKYKSIQHSVFSNIENILLADGADLGIIIHENRFTYQEKGLMQIADLGEMWHNATQLPLPLGCFLIKKNIPLEHQIAFQQGLQNSILRAQQQLPHISNYVQHYAQEMDKNVMRQHIDLYVNDDTFALSEKGIQAIQKMVIMGDVNYVFQQNWLAP